MRRRSAAQTRPSAILTGTVSGVATAMPTTCCAALGAASLSNAEAEATARLFKAIADARRIKIVNLLATSPDPVCVCEFTAQ